MKFHKIISTLGVISLLAVTLLMGVSLARAEERCEEHQVRLDELTIYAAETRETALAYFEMDKYAKVRVDESGIVTTIICDTGGPPDMPDAVLYYCISHAREWAGAAAEDIVYIAATNTGGSTANNTCEDPVCGPSSPCPPGTVFSHYDDHGNPICTVISSTSTISLILLEIPR